MAQIGPQIQQAKQLLQTIRNGPNPALMLNQALMKNPQLREVMNLVQNQYNGDAKAAFYDSAQKLGINPNDIINKLTF